MPPFQEINSFVSKLVGRLVPQSSIPLKNQVYQDFPIKPIQDAVDWVTNEITGKTSKELDQLRSQGTKISTSILKSLTAPFELASREVGGLISGRAKAPVKEKPTVPEVVSKVSDKLNILGHLFPTHTLAWLPGVLSGNLIGLGTEVALFVTPPEKELAKETTDLLSLTKKILSKSSRPQPALAVNMSAPEVDVSAPTIVKALKGFGRDVRDWFVSTKNGRIGQSNAVASILDKIIPEKLDRSALNLYYQLRNETKTVLEKMSQTILSDSKFQPYKGIFAKAFENIRKPSKEFKQAADIVDSYFSHRARDGDIMGYMKNPITNYITQFTINPNEEAFETAMTSPSGVRRTLPQGRVFKNNFEVIEAGYKPATLDTSDIIRAYGQKEATANATVGTINAVKSGHVGAWMSPDDVHKNWISLDAFHPTFRNVTPFISVAEDGSQTAQKATRVFAVPETIADMLKPILQKKDLPSFFQNFRNIQSWMKYVNLGLSIFHVKQLSLVALNSNPMLLARLFKAEALSPEFLEAEVEMLFHGGTTTTLAKTSEAFKNIRFGEETGETIAPQTMGQTMKNVLYDNPVMRAFSALAEKTTGLTFDVIQRRFKVLDYASRMARWTGRHPNASEAELTNARQQTATLINGLYGGLNWESMGITRNLQEVMRTFLLAPDWTISNFVPIARAVRGDPASLRFLASSMVNGILMTQMTNIALTGKPSKDPYNVTLGIDKNGNEIKANLFFAGDVRDMVRAAQLMQQQGFKGLGAFATGKAAPIMGTAESLFITGKDYRGEDIAPRDLPFGEKLLKEGAFALTNQTPVPFSVSNTVQNLTRFGLDVNPAELVISGLGLGYISHTSETMQNQANFYNRLDRYNKLPASEKTPNRKAFIRQAGHYRVLIKSALEQRKAVAASSLPLQEKLAKLTKINEALNILYGKMLSMPE